MGCEVFDVLIALLMTRSCVMSSGHALSFRDARINFSCFLSGICDPLKSAARSSCLAQETKFWTGLERDASHYSFGIAGCLETKNYFKTKAMFQASHGLYASSDCAVKLTSCLMRTEQRLLPSWRLCDSFIGHTCVCGVNVFAGDLHTLVCMEIVY
ncbi:hypothetical protein KP509_05G007600 [Ceratopteris richardii]|uniref:Secreted protein n=1 Tax=Ceratopteris richardii TaxID=49495 RepID=A0A8T2UJ79_CERRI|nr:hypothetical protein KP509_05G007600 [Ceratopteris richardii]